MLSSIALRLSVPSVSSRLQRTSYFFKSLRCLGGSSSAFVIREDPLFTSVCRLLSQRDRLKYGYLVPDRPDQIKACVEKDLKSPEQRDQLVKLLEGLVRQDGSEDAKVSSQKEILSRFDDWAEGRSKFAVAWLLQTCAQGSPQAKEFTTRLVSHLARNLEHLTTDELVALHLLIKIRPEPWSSEEIYSVLDPGVLQSRLAELVDLNRLGGAEVLSICLGLGKLPGFTATDSNFRFALYDQLYKISGQNRLEEVENWTIIYITGLLSKGTHLIMKDDPKIIKAAINSFEKVISRISLQAAIHVR